MTLNAKSDDLPMSERLRRGIAAVPTYSPEKRVELLVRAGVVAKRDRERAIAAMRDSLGRKGPNKGKGKVRQKFAQSTDRKPAITARTAAG